MNRKTKIVATIGPASNGREVLEKMAHAGLDIARFNFAWGTFAERIEQIALIRAVATEVGHTVEVMADLPRMRLQGEAGHTYNKDAAALPAGLTPQDEEFLRFAVAQQLEYVALSFVAAAADVALVRTFLQSIGGTQEIVAKIERKAALDHLPEIIAASDVVMVARGDLGNEVPLEDIPFIQQDILEKTKAAGKRAIVATQMLLSMTEHEAPTRAEVSDVTQAVLGGAWGVMLSEETASGTYPAQAVAEMQRICVDAEAHMHTQTIQPTQAVYAGRMGTLLITRHHESQWNHEGLWTGTRDVHLTEYGFKKSEEMGMLLRDTHIDYAFASMQVRSIETLSSMLTALGFLEVPTEHVAALNERVVPFFEEKVMPLLAGGKNVLLVSHGNALRALMLYVEQIPKEDAAKLEMLFGGVVLYTLDKGGHMVSKEVRQVESHVHA